MTKNVAAPSADEAVAAGMQRLALQVAEARQAVGLEQVQLGVAAGVHSMTISRLERASQVVSVAIIFRIAQALGVRPGDLL